MFQVPDRPRARKRARGRGSEQPKPTFVYNTPSLDEEPQASMPTLVDHNRGASLAPAQASLESGVRTAPRSVGGGRGGVEAAVVTPRVAHGSIAAL